MCHAILRVKYLSDKSPQLIEIDRAQDLAPKVDDLKSKDQVTCVTIFLCHHHERLKKEWRVEPYEPKESPEKVTPIKVEAA